MRPITELQSLTAKPLPRLERVIDPTIYRLGRSGRFAWIRHLLAIIAVLAALALRWALEPFLKDEAPFLLMFAAVMAAAAFGGLGPGLLATFIGGIACHQLFGVPERKISAELVLFLLEGSLLSLLGARLHGAVRHAAVSEINNLNLEQRMLEISDDERRRIGHDLHDGLGQQLTGIALLSKVLQQRLVNAHPIEAQTADQIASLVNQCIAWTRDLARGLSPVTLEAGGVASAMEEAAMNSARVLGVDCHFSIEGEPPEFDAHTSLHVYRIIQEAMSNAVKHGKATSVEVKMKVDSQQVRLTLIDNGIGLSAKTVAQPGLGLQIMRYRARMIGADLSVARARTEGGAVVDCVIQRDRIAPAPGQNGAKHG